VEITVQSDERLTIDTPEQIALELPLAGIGSRFLAVAVDTVLQAALYLTVILTVVFGTRNAGRLPAVLQMMGPAMGVLFLFCVYWGYFAFFEIIWSGRTPGKRVARIRVIKESGRPINAYESIGRNVLRAIDFLPAMYGVGVLVMMLNRQSRRIGDFVAGTVVVYDTVTDEIAPDWRAAPGSAVPNAPMTRVTAEELGLIETYLQRRVDLDPLVRDAMAEQIAVRVTAKTGVAREPGQSVDEFLEGVARRVRDVARFR
jgi:uncharacterized RDD family membrane protein YckC